MTTIPIVLSACLLERRAAIVRSLPEDFVRKIEDSFPEWAHDNQKPPPGDWRVWAIIAGRGFGRTRAGAEWVLGLVRTHCPLPGASRLSLPREGGGVFLPSPLAGEGNASVASEGGGMRIALVAATIDEARAVMVEGASGILACAKPGEVLDWSPGTRTLRFKGAEAILFSGASPEKLRGPEHDFAWCDELAKWPKAQDTWDNLQLGLRRGDRPRVLITTTPRSGPLLDTILDQPDVVESRGSTYDNPFTAAAFKEAVTRMYGGTRFGGQELYGELLRDVEGSLWPGELVEKCRVQRLARVSTSLDMSGEGEALSQTPLVSSPSTRSGFERPGFARIVIGVDPPASANGTCGIVVCGVSTSLDMRGEKIAYVIADESVSGCSPEGWARAVADAFARHGADRVVVEVNQGGDMVVSTLKACSVTLPVEQVRATRAKAVRAEPVAGLFENGRAFFCGRFPELEAELGRLTIGGGYQGPPPSPDRADAMVWALWALMLKDQRVPGIRRL